jgi:hypothetical protein
MLDRKATLEKFGYDTDIISDKSKKLVVAKCDACPTVRTIMRISYNRLCKDCLKKVSKNWRHSNNRSAGKTGDDIESTEGFNLADNDDISHQKNLRKPCVICSELTRMVTDTGKPICPKHDEMMNKVNLEICSRNGKRDILLGEVAV